MRDFRGPSRRIVDDSIIGTESVGFAHQRKPRTIAASVPAQRRVGRFAV
jgi:hypothetical protein